MFCCAGDGGRGHHHRHENRQPEGVSGPGGHYPLSRKLGWLNKMLWGGSALLAFEHLWHGEVTPWFPFLTAAANPEDAAVMFHEIATVGVSMSLVVTGVWAAMVLVSNALVRRKARHGEETL